MPELGTATYELVFDTRQVKQMTTAEKVVVDATQGMDEGIITVEDSMRKLAQTFAQTTSQLEGSLAGADAAASAFADSVESSTARMASSTTANVAKADTALGGLKTKFMAMGKIRGQSIGFGAAIGAYLFVKGGIDYLKNINAATLQVNNAIHNTGKITGVTRGEIDKLAQAYVGANSQTKATLLQTGSLLARFTAIRNIGPGVGMIYDRAFKAIQDAAVGSQKSVKLITVGVGKILTDPIKNISALSRAGITFNPVQKTMIQNMIAGGHAAAAQNYILDVLENKYGGSAQASIRSFGGQWTKLKDSFDEVSAQILKGLVPALTKLTGYMVQHKSLVRGLVIALIALAAAYVSIKAAAIAFNIVMTGIKIAQFTASFVGLTGGIAESSTAAIAGRTAMLAWGESMIWALGPIALLVGALVILEYTIRKVQQAQAQAQAAVLNPGMGGGAKGELRASEALFHQQREKRYMEKGYSAVEANKMATADTRKTFASADKAAKQTGFGTKGQMSAGSAAMAKLQKEGAKYAKPTSTSTMTTTGGAFASNPELAKLQQGILVAQRTKSLADDKKALDAEKTWLEKMIAQHKFHGADLVKANKALTAVDKQLMALAKKTLTEVQKGAFKLGDIPLALQAAYSKALGTKTLSDDKKALEAEESYFQGIYNNRKNTYSVREKALSEIESIQSKIKSINNKMLASQEATFTDIQSFENDRGSFFSQFASSVFHQGAGGLEMGSSGGTNKSVQITQNNQFHEVPKDRYATGRKMAAAAAGGM